ncbi:PEP-CTERM protein-sorting domain-containing protein [Duganella sp. CF517]|uniref:PEPxxWA-CTERM sorting domain-containing protein n=1 Tax=Duganella sp. CF517 TaxID=1881038 RepID=UPI0008C2AD41|nr:PEPxxWA-CTERM sorting domain-containing protein [Duganella sp. CF517]SEN85927.1 PEP-CTERM protein-sorting domain-containing protein [Duganella sp. CF517]
MKRTIIAAALAIGALSTAHAATINGLVNTGVGASGTADTHYALSSASTTSTVPVITYNNQWPISPWIGNDASSKWITPTADQAQSFDAWSTGTYTYSLSFDLSGYNAGTAAFNARVAADNSVVVLLNNQTISSASGFTGWNDFAAHGGFVAGVNKLDFVVTNWAQNGGNPTGLRVEFTDSTVAPVPEPETYAMMLGGLALVGAIARRRKSK